MKKKSKITATNNISAIIGYWRSGASVVDIASLTGLPYISITNIIYLHKKKTNEA
jgi:hypothetical protein